MKRIPADDAFGMLEKWREARATIRVVMTRPSASGGGQRATSEAMSASSAAVIDQVLPHSQKALLTMRDGDGDAVAVTMDLREAEWEWAVDGGTLAATFANGNRYVFGSAETSTE